MLVSSARIPIMGFLSRSSSTTAVFTMTFRIDSLELKEAGLSFAPATFFAWATFQSSMSLRSSLDM